MKIYENLWKFMNLWKYALFPEKEEKFVHFDQMIAANFNANIEV